MISENVVHCLVWLKQFVRTLLLGEQRHVGLTPHLPGREEGVHCQLGLPHPQCRGIGGLPLADTVAHDGGCPDPQLRVVPAQWVDVDTSEPHPPCLARVHASKDPYHHASHIWHSQCHSHVHLGVLLNEDGPGLVGGEVGDAKLLGSLHAVYPVVLEGGVVESVAIASDKEVGAGLGLLQS